MTTFGEINWSDNIDGDKKNNKDLFLHLDSGDNEVRLLTSPFQYSVHKIKSDPTNPKDYGQKVFCSAIHGSCPACNMGDKAKTRWYLGVISRKDQTYKILDISFAVFSAIRKLNNNTKHWGDPTKYDVNIVVNREGKATDYYSVQPLPKSPLSAADQVIKDNLDLEELKRKVSPPTPEQAQKRLDKVLGKDSSVGSTSTVSTSSTPKATTKTAVKTVAAPAPVVEETDDAEMDEEFPDFNASA